MATAAVSNRYSVQPDDNSLAKALIVDNTDRSSRPTSPMQQQHSSLNLNSSSRKYEFESDISQSVIADEVSRSLR